MSVNVFERMNNIKKRLKEIRYLTSNGVLVGFPGNGKARKGDKITNAEIAYYQEFGTSKIPARPFLTPAVQNNLDEIAKLLKPNADNPKDSDSLNRAGLYVTAKAKENITKQQGFAPFKPLSPKTIKARKSKRKSGEAGTKALIDTGQLRQSITYVIEKESSD